MPMLSAEQQKLREKTTTGNPFGVNATGLPSVNPMDMVKKLTSMGDNTPKMAKYEDIRDPSGALKSQFQIKDPGAVKSPWLDQQLQQQAAQQTQQLNQGARQAATGAAAAQASLARRGGLSGGSAERLAGASQEQAALQAQDIRGAGDQQRLGMQSADMQNERQYQTGLQQSNLANTLADVASKREFDMNKYQEQMKAYGADKSAAAVEKACFLAGTMVKMVDGTEKAIETLIPGEQLALGGEVKVVMKCLLEDSDRVYNYTGVYVTGHHYVREMGEWLKVKDSKLGQMTLIKGNFVYNLITENHRIIIRDVTFWDYADDFVPKTKEASSLGIF